MSQGQQQLDSSLAALSSSYPRLQMPSTMMQGLASASPYPGDLSMLIFNLITFPLFQRLIRPLTRIPIQASQWSLPPPFMGPW